ncbi:zinc finger MYND domain-containing protein 15 [Tanacetum coccineum]
MVGYMDSQLKTLFSRYREQFGSGPGLGLGSGTCLMNVENVSHSFIKAMFKAAAALYRTDPWKRLRPDHLFGLRVGKDSDWAGKKQPFPCVQFVGGDGGDLALYMFRSENDARKTMGSRETIRAPNVEVMRATYEVQSLMLPSHKKMIKALSLEVSGTDRFPVFDVCRCNSSGELRSRNPTIEELRFMYGVMKAVSLVHPLLEEDDDTPKWSKFVYFEPFIETVDVQWPPEMSKGNDIVAVTVSHPPGQGYTEKVNSSGGSTPTKHSDFRKEETFFDLRSTGISRQCAQCEKDVSGEHITYCDHCHGVIYCNAICQKQHWKKSHKGVCGLYKAMMEREDELAINIFTFPCSNENPCKYLDLIGNGVHRKGMWRRKCPCYSHCPFGLLPTTDKLSDSWGGLDDDVYPHESLLQRHGISNPILLSSWLEYYNLRSLPLSSPVADILSHPLTVYYILTTLSVISKNLLLKGKEVVLHYIGPEEELDWMPAFTEISHILNGMGNVQIVMVGPGVPTNLSGSTSGISSRVRVNIVRGIYQEEAPYLPPPHVVIGLNCGFESYSSWAGALELIKAKGLPAFFTDQSEILCTKAKQVIRGAGLHITHPVTPNPFRSPVRNYSVSTNLPSYSNGFVLGVNT